MRYAIIADIHGNLPAFEAVLEDAERRGADEIVVLGDYAVDFPWPNGVAERLRKLRPYAIVRGNKEQMLLNLLRQSEKNWTSEQFAASYWTGRALSEKNIQYYREMEERLRLRLHGTDVYVAHSPDAFFGHSAASCVDGISYMRMLEQGEAKDWEDFMGASKQRLAVDPFIREAVPGIYLFGHFHAQWHARVGGCLLINPGACGLALDGSPDAPYTLLEYEENTWRVEEVRVSYDLRGVALALRSASLYAEAPIWSEINIYQLETGLALTGKFFAYMRREYGESRAISNAAWRRGGSEFVRLLHEGAIF